MTALADWIDLRAQLPWLRGQFVHVVAAEREAHLRAVLAANGFACHTLDGTEVTDAPRFFAKISGALRRSGGPVEGWDALNDALGALDDASSRRHALVWRGADMLARSDLGTFVAATTALDAAARDLGSLRDDGTPPLQLEIFLLSKGPGVS